MAHQDFFIRVPPDSTGKRVRNRVDLTLAYQSATGSFESGDLVTGATSGMTGIVFDVAASATAGTISVLLSGSAEAANDGENLQVLGSIIALADGVGTPFYNQAVMITGANDPDNQAFVNSQGEVSVAVGHEDAIGRLQTNSPGTIFQYILNYDDLPNRHSTTLTGGGTSTHDASAALVTIGNGTVSGDKAERRTHLYHPFHQGISQLIEQSIVCGDSGKVDLRRRWGYYDDDDGLFWELPSGANAPLSVVIRESVGTASSTTVTQSSWNVDRLDGTGGAKNGSKITLDVTKANLYWMDFQWVGAGRVRFGVNIDGKRIVVHEFNNANNEQAPFMRTGQLPLSWEIENLNTVVSTSEMKVMDGTVKIEAGARAAARTLPFSIGMSAFQTVSSVASAVPLFSFRSTSSINSIDNRTVTIPDTLSLTASTGTVLIQLVENASLLGASFFDVSTGESGTQIDFSASQIGGGQPLVQFYLKSQTKDFDLSDVFGLAGRISIRRADITASSDIFTVQARRVSASGTDAIVTGSLNWKEVK